MVNAMKRQMEGHDEKFECQLSRLQQHSDRLRERLDSKMVGVEAMNTKFDRKLAELSGNYKGLSEEMQSQIRRIDNLDTKLWEWRHQVDEENRNKFAEVEQGLQTLTSQVRLSNATMEDSFKRFSVRIRRVEQVIEDRLSFSDETNHNLMALDVRLQEIEAARLQELSLARPAVDPASLALVAEAHRDVSHVESTSPLLATVEARLAEAFRKLEHVSKESQDVQTRVEAQEERLRSLRTIVDAKEDSYRVSKFDRQDWESKAKHLDSVASELERHRVEHSERLDVFQRMFENQDQAQAELCDQVQRVQEGSAMGSAAGSARVLHDDDSINMHEIAYGSMMDSNAECTNRLFAAEEKLNAMGNQIVLLQGDSELAPRVAMLVEALQQVAPKVMDQEVCMRNFHEKVGHLDAKVVMLCDQGKANANEHRLGMVEMELRRLCAEIDGTEQFSRGSARVA